MSELRVTHDIPGRLRLRLPVGASTDGVQPAIAAAPGVTSCAWSPLTRSLLVSYDPEHGSRHVIIDAVAQASGITAPPDTGVSMMTEPGPTFAIGVRQLVGEVDQRVQRVTRGLLGLGGLLPVALTAWAITEVVRGRAAPLAWSSALWYAHGLFRDYQVPGPRD